VWSEGSGQAGGGSKRCPRARGLLSHRGPLVTGGPPLAARTHSTPLTQMPHSISKRPRIESRSSPGPRTQGRSVIWMSAFGVSGISVTIAVPRAPS
jgi:hypothetical protein